METKTDRDCIEISLPFKAEYVGVARLTASGIASRIGFDIDEIEDIKVAVAEVCNKLIKTGSSTARYYSILFEICDGLIRIVFDCEDKSLKCNFGNGDDELGISIITALMDSVDFCPRQSYLLSMTKAIKGNSHNDG